MGGAIVPVNPVESGLATTEFWATQITSLVLAIILVLSVFNVIAWSEPQKAAVVGLLGVAITVAQGLYAIARGLRKQNAV